MAQTQRHEAENVESVTIAKSDWISAGRAAGFVMRDDGAMLLFKDGMLAWLPNPLVNGGLTSVARAMAEFGANRGGQSLNGISFQESVTAVARGDGPSAKVANNNAEERAFKAFLEPLAASKLNIDLDGEVSKEDRTKLNQFVAAASEAPNNREKYFATARDEALAAGNEKAEAKAKRTRTKKSTGDFAL
jgi:hypothetical protein